MSSFKYRKDIDALRAKRTGKESCEANYSRINIYDKIIYEGIKDHKNTNMINLDKILCPRNKCSLFHKGEFISWDTDPHLSYKFSLEQSIHFDKYLNSE
jgi:hypothetical protein